VTCVLVTGGCGFIGSTLVRRLVGDGHDVLNVDALTYAGLPQNVADVAGASNYSFLEADIRDGAAVAQALEAFGPDAVMHLAAESHVDRSIDDPMDFLSTNVLGTAAVLRAVEQWLPAQPVGRRDAFRLLHISTDEVYGALGADGAFTEDSPVEPNSPYAASKAASDLMARAWARTWKLPVIVCRSSNNYGPRQFPEKLIPRTIISALHGRPIEVYARGENVRDWIHVEDNVDALLRVLERGALGSVYNIGAGNERRNIDLVRDICGLLDERAPRETGATADLIAFVEDRPGHDFRYAIDNARLAGELDWQPSVAPADGLRQTVDWYLANRDWWAPLLDDVYDGGRLGLGG
jgi:dTDP-glucose 4,6-dehydratase